MVVFASEPMTRLSMVEVAPGAHGITIADVTGATRHGSVDPAAFIPFGRDAESFMAGLGASPDFTVEGLRRASLGRLEGWSGRVVPKPGRWSHIMIRNVGGHAAIDLAEFGNANLTWVADLDDALVLVEGWADTNTTLDQWLPVATAFVDSLRFEVRPAQ